MADRTISSAQVGAGEAAHTTGGRDLGAIMGVIANRARLTGRPPSDITSNANEFNIFGQPQPAGTGGYYTAEAQAILDSIMAGHQYNLAGNSTSYALPSHVQNLQEGLTPTFDVKGGHRFFEDPLNRPIGTSTGYAPILSNPRPFGVPPMPQAKPVTIPPPAPTPAPVPRPAPFAVPTGTFSPAPFAAKSPLGSIFSRIGSRASRTPRGTNPFGRFGALDTSRSMGFSERSMRERGEFSDTTGGLSGEGGIGSGFGGRTTASDRQNAAREARGRR